MAALVVLTVCPLCLRICGPAGSAGQADFAPASAEVTQKVHNVTSLSNACTGCYTEPWGNCEIAGCLWPALSWQLVHDGHCAGGYLGTPQNVQWGNQVVSVTSRRKCALACRHNTQCGFFAYYSPHNDCPLYSLAASCPDDNQYGEYNAYRINRYLLLHEKHHCSDGFIGHAQNAHTLDACAAACLANGNCAFISYTGSICALYTRYPGCYPAGSGSGYNSYTIIRD